MLCDDSGPLFSPAVGPLFSPALSSPVPRSFHPLWVRSFHPLHPLWVRALRRNGFTRCGSALFTRCGSALFSPAVGPLFSPAVGPRSFHPLWVRSFHSGARQSCWDFFLFSTVCRAVRDVLAGELFACCAWFSGLTSATVHVMLLLKAASSLSGLLSDRRAQLL